MKKIKNYIFIITVVLMIFFSLFFFRERQSHILKNKTAEVENIFSGANILLEIIQRDIAKVKISKEFSDHINSTEKNFYKFFKLYTLFIDTLYIDDLSETKIGFFDITNDLLIFGNETVISKQFFNRINLQLDEFIENDILSHVHEKELYLFMKENHKEKEIVWIINIDLEDLYKEAFTKNMFSWSLYNQEANLLYSQGDVNSGSRLFKKGSKYYYHYSIKMNLSTDDYIYIANFILLTILLLFLISYSNKIFGRQILNNIANVMSLNNPPKAKLEDITTNIHELLKERNKIREEYFNRNVKYEEIIIKEYILGLESVDFKEVEVKFKNLKDSLFRLVKLSTSDKDEIPIEAIEKLKEIDGLLYINFTSNEACLLLSNHTKEFMKKIEEILRDNLIKMYVSKTYDFISLKGAWKSLNKEIHMYNAILSKETVFLENTISIGKKEKNKERQKDKMIAYIEENYNKNISLIDLAEIIEETPKYTSFLFRKYTNMNFKEFLTLYRIEEAKKILENNPETKISDLYAMVGYNNVNPFIRAFKKIEGVSPGSWISSNKK